MIVELSSRRTDLERSTEDRVLEELRAYWQVQRGAARAPLSDGLYLSDLVDEMPYVLLCFRDAGAFRIEFAGAEAQDMLGFDPTGEVLRPEDSEPVLATMARCAAVTALRPAPEVSQGDGWKALLLPFVDPDHRVTVLLVGLVLTMDRISAKILAFPTPGPDRR